MSQKVPDLIPANDVASDNILGDSFFLWSKWTNFLHLLFGLLFEVIESFFSLLFFFVQVIDHFTDFTESFIRGWLRADSIGLLAGSENDLLSDGIFLEIDWGRSCLLFGVDNELGSDGFGTFGRSDTCVLSKSIPGLLHHSLLLKGNKFLY
jgi:hypothetical protein